MTCREQPEHRYLGDADRRRGDSAHDLLALDYVRALTYQVMASKLVRKLNLPVLQAAISASVTQGVSQSGQAVRDLNQIGWFVMGNAISVPLEAFWAPIFLCVLFVLHWLYGLVASFWAIIILSLSLLSVF